MRPMKFGFGQPVRRVEDHRLTTGTGVEGALHAFVLRSQYAHATFKIRDKDAARKMKGVKLILTGEDVAHLGDIPCKGLIKTVSGDNVEPLPVPVLPTDIVRHVGEAVAFIVAETLDQARDAAEARRRSGLTGRAMSPSRPSRATRPRRTPLSQRLPARSR